MWYLLVDSWLANVCTAVSESDAHNNEGSFLN